MRTFVDIRSFFRSQNGLSDKITQLEKKYDHQFKVVFDAIREFMQPSKTEHREIGIHTKIK